MSSHITLKGAFTAPSVGNLSNNGYIPENPIPKNPISEGISPNSDFFGSGKTPIGESPKNFAPFAPA